MITIVVPAYNEEEVIELLVNSLENKIKLDQPWEILVVNDGSRDRTAEILETLKQKYNNLNVIHHEKNQNLGGALRTGIKNASGEIIVTMDADMTHSPEILPQMINCISNSDVVVASRFVPGGGMKNVPTYRVLISRCANIGYQILFLSPVRDNTGGYKAYRAELLKSVEIVETGFSVQLEIMTKLLKKKARFTEIPFVLVNRELGTSKLNYLNAIPKYVKRVMHLLRIRWM